jgi:hypothetical protein
MHHGSFTLPTASHQAAASHGSQHLTKHACTQTLLALYVSHIHYLDTDLATCRIKATSMQIHESRLVLTNVSLTKQFLIYRAGYKFDGQKVKTSRPHIA